MKKVARALIAVALWSRAVLAAPTVSPLEVRFLDEYGGPLGGVETTVRGNGKTWTYPGSPQSELRLKLPEGIYEITFTRVSFYDLVLKGVAIEARKHPRAINPLRVKMNFRFRLVQDPVITGPRYTDPPPLEIAFRPEPEIREGRPAHGVFTLRNLGAEPILVPLEREFRWTPETLVMRLGVKIEGLNINFDEPFVCVPPDCLALQPGESIEFSVRLDSEKRPVRWYQTGKVEGNAGVYFVPPFDHGAQPIYTRRIEAVFHLRVGD